MRIVTLEALLQQQKSCAGWVYVRRHGE